MKSPKRARRYRTEDGLTCIDIRLRNSRQLFDGRDPAPFRERDLDEGAVDYITGALQELPPDAPVKIAFWIAEAPTEPLSASTIVEAVRAHFTYLEERLSREIRQHVRQGYLFLFVGLVALMLFLFLAELTVMLSAGQFPQILREGLVITGWVALWRPLETLLYDWWPLARQRKLASRILRAPISVHHGVEPEA